MGEGGAERLSGCLRFPSGGEGWKHEKIASFAAKGMVGCSVYLIIIANDFFYCCDGELFFFLFLLFLLS